MLTVLKFGKIITNLYLKSSQYLKPNHPKTLNSLRSLEYPHSVTLSNIINYVNRRAELKETALQHRQTM
jgi:hypothetical protein